MTRMWALHSGRIRCALLFAGLLLAASAVRAATVEQLEIVTKGGVRVFEVEMAVTPQEQETGLMYRRELPEGKGMLFDMGEERPAVFWIDRKSTRLYSSHRCIS